MKTLTKIIILSFLFVGGIDEAQALSCIQTAPVIGVIDSFEKSEALSVEVMLRDVYTFTAQTISDKPDTYVIDIYEKIAREYVTNDYMLEIEATHYNSNVLTYPEEAFRALDIAVGDIVMTAPPFHVCSLRFNGFFTPEGELEMAFINDAYSDYAYRGIILSVSPGKEVMCGNENNDLDFVDSFGESGVCQVGVDFSIDEEAFSLEAGASHTPTFKGIDQITLIDAKHYKDRSQDRAFFDWGFGTNAHYVIEFGDDTKPEKPIVPPTNYYIEEPIEENLQETLMRQIIELLTQLLSLLGSR